MVAVARLRVAVGKGGNVCEAQRRAYLERIAEIVEAADARAACRVVDGDESLPLLDGKRHRVVLAPSGSGEEAAQAKEGRPPSAQPRSRSARQHGQERR